MGFHNTEIRLVKLVWDILIRMEQMDSSRPKKQLSGLAAKRKEFNARMHEKGVPGFREITAREFAHDARVLGKAGAPALLGAGIALGSMSGEAEAAPKTTRSVERADAINTLLQKLSSIQARHEQVITDAEYACIVENVYHEARGENDMEKLRVALVTLSRVIDEGRRYPSTPCGVVYEPVQFSWTLSDTLKNAKKNERQMRRIGTLMQKLVHGQTASTAVTLLSLALGMRERPLFYKRTDDVGVSERSKEFFKTLVPVDLGPGEQPGAHTFYRLPTRAEIAARHEPAKKKRGPMTASPSAR